MHRLSIAVQQQDTAMWLSTAVDKGTCSHWLLSFVVASFEEFSEKGGKRKNVAATTAPA
jgi:alpha-D-ribose 1-methylphosphonate 5-triphosphate synthase subunit PhnH